MVIRPFSSNRFLQAMILWLVLIGVVTAIEPLYPRDWLLENLLVFIWCGILLFSYRRFQFSNLSYGLFVLFISLHLVGAHYTYSETPFGFWMQDWFGFERNHYDRLVHFTFGLLLAYPMREILLRTSGLKISWSYFIVVNCILAFSAIRPSAPRRSSRARLPALPTAPIFSACRDLPAPAGTPGPN